MINLFIQILFFPLPWSIRKLLLRGLGFELGPGSKIGYSILKARKVILDENSKIGHLNFFRDLDLISLAKDSYIGNMNWVSGAMSKANDKNSEFFNSSLILGTGAAISNRHYIDCNAIITLGQYCTFAGVRSQIFTHSVDLNLNIQRVASVSFGEYTFIGSGCIILPGAILPKNSILSAGSILRKGLSFESDSGMYTGNPAVFERHISENALYFKRITPTVSF